MSGTALANPQGWNRYAYVEGDPVNWMDPQGLGKCPPGSENTCIEVTDTMPGVPTGLSDFIKDAGRYYDSRRFSWDGMPYAEWLARQMVAQQNVQNAFTVPRPLADIPAESCSLTERFWMACDDSGAELALAAVVGRNFDPWGLAVGAAWSGMARAVGLIGQQIVGGKLRLPSNGAPIKDTLSGTWRIPDFWDTNLRTIYEVKNTSYVSMSSQIRDMADWASRHNYTFVLWYREGAGLSSTIKDAAARGWIQLQPFVWP